ncbi:MAG: lipopolysaccharide biosynthesis protein [Hydrogenophilales bacterium 28-61-23]|nr:MAG: lipopolysaccharide biosynthesis protein [Hydrogenophilales bacterium 28-61-23]
MCTDKAIVIAAYLPQYHPISENDEWWGAGFTEWVNASKARPLFPSHYQPHIPADLGFYDLRLPETRIAQADMARKYGVNGFCYYHYWFAGKRILERPFNEVLQSGAPDFPFCLNWANQSWTGVWHGASKRVLMEQTYPGDSDHRNHFEALLPAFFDKRYIRVDGKPLFFIFRPAELPDAKRTLDLWREMAVRAGLPGLFFVAEHQNPYWPASDHGFDAILNTRGFPKRREWVSWKTPLKKIHGKILDIRGVPTIVNYGSMSSHFVPDHDSNEFVIPCVIPNWDNTPRSGFRGYVLHGSSPDLFRVQLRRALDKVARYQVEKRFVYVKSWNEWAEGNHLEPDRKFGHGYLKALKEEVSGGG